MSPITPEQVRHVAKLARLAIPESDIPRLSQQLAGILDYVAHIGEVNVDGVEPMAHALPLTNVLRADEPTPGLPIEDVLRNAPDIDERFFKVPKVLGGDEDSAG
jgi:aspartyl-tRNA(Asn)/glutamyl-tRNA(Gln) amidotransferase subunit C